MKTCSSCCKLKDTSEFYAQGKKRLQSKCKSCFNSYCIERWRQRKIRALKYKGGSCIDCGYDKHPAALQFHHLRDKKATWVKMRLWSWYKVTDELDKCVVLCANCHAVRHATASVMRH